MKKPEALKEVLHRLVKRKASPVVDMAPGCPFGAVVDQRLKEVERGIGEVKARLNWLLFLLIGAVLTQVLVRLAG